MERDYVVGFDLRGIAGPELIRVEAVSEDEAIGKAVRLSTHSLSTLQSLACILLSIYSRLELVAIAELKRGRRIGAIRAVRSASNPVMDLREAKGFVDSLVASCGNKF